MTTSYAKIEITGTLTVLTGLQIGAGDGFSAIGAVDKPVVRDPLSRLPMIPGTSLKGKVRTLLSRQYGADTETFYRKPNEDHAHIRRLFGDTEEYMTGRLVFRDTKLTNKDDLEARGAKTLTEVKFENAINRVTAKANLRQMERVIPGSEFAFSLVYEVSFGTPGEEQKASLPSSDEIIEDFNAIARGLKLLELDYLGGSGTRGYGQVKFSNLKARAAVGALDGSLLEKLNHELATAISRTPGVRRMNTYLKPFELTLRCLGPVFIGSGEKRTSKEYHVEGDRVYFPDMELLYADIPAHKRKSFEAFVMNTDGAQATAPLKEWVEPNAVKLDPAKHRGYEVKIGSIEPRRASRGRGGRMTRKKLTLNEIHAFIKDPLGRPYVPGSTVKGMLRSIYLQSLVHKRTAQPVRVPGHQTREHRQYGERFERKELRKSGRPNTRPQDAVNDLFQAIRVTDSPALRTSDLLICQKMDMNVHGKPDGLPLFRECLAPGTSISHRVVVDTSPTARGGWREGERFLETLAETAASVNQARYAEYRAMYPGVNAIVGPIVYLGGGAGYRSKTFVTDQDDMAKVLDAQFGKVVKHVDKTRELRVSPLVLKRTKIDNICYEMGQCELSIRRAE